MFTGALSGLQDSSLVEGRRRRQACRYGRQLQLYYINNSRHWTTINLPVVLYGCETWSLTQTEEHRLRVFENRALRKIFRPKRDEVEKTTY
jgi:hypothetical protein